MSRKLFIGGLSWDTQDNGLRQAFEDYGTVTDATVITDRHTGRSRGFGFVTFAEPEAAAKAKVEMNGVSLDGRSIRVDEAHDKRSGGGGGGGGYGGGGGGGGYGGGGGGYGGGQRW